MSTYQKKLGTLLGSIFGAKILSLFYGYSAPLFLRFMDYKIFNIGNILFNILIAVLILLIAKNKEMCRTSKARTASWCYFAVQSIITINSLLFSFGSKTTTEFMGAYAHIVYSILIASAIILFLFSLKIWTPIKILGSISAIPAIISGFLFYSLEKLQGLELGSAYKSVVFSLGGSSLASLIFEVVTMILCLVWANKTFKPKANNPIQTI